MQIFGIDTIHTLPTYFINTFTKYKLYFQYFFFFKICYYLVGESHMGLNTDFELKLFLETVDLEVLSFHYWQTPKSMLVKTCKLSVIYFMHSFIIQLTLLTFVVT